MEINKIKQAAEIAKTRTNDKRWLAAIDKAVAGVESGWWIITELRNCLAITTETGKTYFANGECQCEAYRRSTACKHRALYRLYQIAQEEVADVATSTAPEAVSPASDSAAPVYCACCGAPADQEWDTCPSCGVEGEWMTEDEFFDDEVATSSRANLIAEIENIWPRVAPGVPLYTELLARFGKSKLSMLDDDCLRRVRLAIAM
jgi:hypothetical protein